MGKRKTRAFAFISLWFLTSLLTACTKSPSNPTNNANGGGQAAQGGGASMEGSVSEPTPDIRGENEKNYPDARYASDTIYMKEEQPVAMQKLDDAIQAKLETGGYTFEEPYVELNPYQTSPLTALALFQTEKERKVRVTVKGDDASADVVGELEAAKRHRVPIIGLYPNRENTVVLELLSKKGKVLQTKELAIRTGPLPEFMEGIVTVKQKGEDTAYPLTILSGMGAKYPFAYDYNGAVRWYVEKKTEHYGLFPLSNHRYILQYKGEQIPTKEKPHTTTMYEMDYLGRIHAQYYVKNGYHHEVIEKTPGGNLLLLSSSVEEYVEDVVTEIDRETGNVEKSLDMREVFGPLKYVDRVDWVHLNTVSYKEGDDSLLLSPRNLHAGLRLDWKTNEVKWILGNPRFWEGTAFADKVLKPVGDIVWFFQPHSIYEIPYDLDKNPDTIHVMAYDNHWDKTRKVDYFDERTESYVSFFTIDEAKGTVSQDRIYPGRLSIITSNCAFDFEWKRVFGFAGYLHPEVEGEGGLVYEYDYDSGATINLYATTKRFYRGYQMLIDYNECALPMDIGEGYNKGELQEPVEVAKVKAPKKAFDGEDVTFTLRGSKLYMKANDHAVSKVEWVGENHFYRMDYSYLGDGEEDYAKRSYEHVFPLQSMKPDTYRIVIEYHGKRYDTGREVTVRP